MDYIYFAAIGIAAGFLGGLLGIGGGIIVIPALVLLASLRNEFSGSYQHLIQAAAMICNFCVCLPAAIGHWRSGAVIREVISKLIPSAFFGVLFGVFLSNTFIFAGDNGKYLLVLLSIFMVYVSIYNIRRVIKPKDSETTVQPKCKKHYVKAILSGIVVGTQSGLLGVGGGSLCVPAQQIFLNVPLKNAIANSSWTILTTVFVGAIYKNMTLAGHGYSYTDSITIAACIAPTAIISSFIGSKVTHKVNTKILRLVYIFFMVLVSIILINKAIKA